MHLKSKEPLQYYQNIGSESVASLESALKMYWKKIEDFNCFWYKIAFKSVSIHG